MKIYEVYARVLDSEGNYRGTQRLGLYLDKENAQMYVDAWQELWDKHSNVDDPAYGHNPCCLGYDRGLEIREVETND